MELKSIAARHSDNGKGGRRDGMGSGDDGGYASSLPAHTQKKTSSQEA
jgi:hypothetical protein